MVAVTLKEFVIGALGNNSYLLFNEKSKNSFLIDCPSPTDQLKEYISKNNLNLLFIALTHSHFDHISGLNDFDVDIYIHEQEKTFLSDPDLNGSSYFISPLIVNKAPKVYDKNCPLIFEGIPIEVFHTPGHTPGGVSLKFNDLLFCGDTLFLQSVGRTDMPRASHEVLIKSIKEKLMVLPKNTIVYPGHGPKTTIGQELENNPYL